MLVMDSFKYIYIYLMELTFHLQVLIQNIKHLAF